MIVFYARVSTTEQTTAHQRTQAEQAGFRIDKVVADEGISGVSTRLAERPEGKRLFDLLRVGDTLVVRWVDRLGRDYTDVVDTIRELMRRGVIIKTVINGMTFDGSTTEPMQQAVRDAPSWQLPPKRKPRQLNPPNVPASTISAERSRAHTWGASRPMTGRRSTASGLLSTAPTRRAYRPSRRPSACRSRRYSG
jgi:Resolvase, N terminal domain